MVNVRELIILKYLEHTILPQIMARAFISFQQLFTPATKQDQRLLIEVLNQSFSGDEF